MKTWESLAPRERDALVATEIMGWERGTGRKHLYWVDPADPDSFYGTGWIHPDGPGDYDFNEFSPTTSIACAWEVVEKAGLSLLQTDDGWLAFDPGPYGQISYPEPGVCNGVVDLEILVGSPWAVAPTAPEAICKAALAARGTDA